jgi:hypothetical protein
MAGINHDKLDYGCCWLQFLDMEIFSSQKNNPEIITEIFDRREDCFINH